MSGLFAIGLFAAGGLVLILAAIVFARLARLPGYGWRLAIVLGLVWAGLVAVFVSGPPLPGIDLVGGVCLNYEFRPDPPDGSRQPADAAHIERVIRNRLRGTDAEVSVQGGRSVEVIVPGSFASERQEGVALAARVKAMLESSGTLEFRILANPRDHHDLIERAQREGGNELRNGAGRRLAWWVPVDPKQRQTMANDPEVARRTRRTGDSQVDEVLVVGDDYNVTGDLLKRVAAGIDERGQPCVLFSFGELGAARFGGLTGSNTPDNATGFTRRLGILIDGQLHSAPGLRSAIFSDGQITGQFSQQEVEHLVNVLNAGSLPGHLEIRGEMTIGPAVSSMTRDRVARTLCFVAGGLLFLQLLVVLLYRLVGLAAVAVWYVHLLLVEGSLLALHVRQVTGFGVVALVLSLVPAIMSTLMICAMIRHSRKGGADVRTAIRDGVVGAILPVCAVHLALLLIGMTVYVMLGGGLGLAGFIFALTGVVGPLTCLFCLHALLGIVERLIRNTGPTATWVLFPGTRRQEVVTAQLAA